MTFGFLNLAILLGLAGLAIPPIIHWLYRRRPEVLSWGAMQFLLSRSAPRRRFRLEEIFLLLTRMGLIALVVLGLATPYAGGPIVGKFLEPGRDVVLVWDGSLSMEHSAPGEKSPWEKAREKLLEEIKKLRSGDRAAVIFATQPPLAIVEELTALSADDVRLESLPAPRGAADWPAALELAEKLLSQGTNPAREVVVCTDLQHFGWADEATLLRWQQFGQRWRAEHPDGGLLPSWRWLSVQPEKLGRTNFVLGPLRPSRNVVGIGQKVRFTADWSLAGTDRPLVPRRFLVDVDGERIQETAPEPVPTRARQEFSFEHRFSQPGLHRVELMLEPSEGDALAGDNKQELVVEVVRELPILLIDGDAVLGQDSSTYFLGKAFAEPEDPGKVSVVVPTTTPAVIFRPEMLQGEDRRPRPALVILADVPSLAEEQVSALKNFVQAGGGLWIVLGPRVEKSRDRFNELFYDQGLSPLRLEQVATVEKAAPARLEVDRFLHPALQVFREEPHCSLRTLPITQWWRGSLAKDSNISTLAGLSTSDPWLIEKSLGRGRVLVSTLPLDGSWNGTLSRAWEFPVLVHELVYSLAEVRSSWNLSPGQPIRLQPRIAGVPIAVSGPALLHTPWGKTRPVELSPTLTLEPPGPAGSYRLDLPELRGLPLVVQSEPRESELRYLSDEDRQKILEVMPWSFESDDGEGHRTVPIWWLFFAGLLGFLLLEVWLTRRIVQARGLA